MSFSKHTFHVVASRRSQSNSLLRKCAEAIQERSRELRVHLGVSLKKKKGSIARRTCLYRRTILIAVFSMVFSTAGYAQSEDETVNYDIPASTLPQALREFARQSRIELVFAERGYDNVRTQAVIGLFQRERALEMLLAGTGLRVGFGSGDSVIVQRAESVEATTELTVGGLDEDPLLMARAAIEGSETAAKDIGDYAGSEGQPPLLANQSSPGERSQRVDEITVTGSRIRGAQSASPIVTIDRAEIDMAGFATVEEVVENLPQNFGAGASLDADPVTNSLAVGGDVKDFFGGTSVNLRGLGASSTLVLLNGRRMSPSGNEGRFTNIASIPVTAIDRVEVMTDGASAVYGSDAIGGVINFILRENYEGAETRLRYGSDGSGDTSSVQLGQSFGTSWNSGSVLLSYEYFDSGALESSDRDFAQSSDLTRFGGTDWRQPGGIPANIRVGPSGDRVFYAIPDGQDGTGLTPADFADLENSQNLFNERVAIDITPDVERHAGFLHATQRVGVLNLFGAARFSREENIGRSAASLLIDFPSVTSASPHFVDPTGTGLTEVRIDNYSLLSELGPQIQVSEIESLGATLGAQVEFADNWYAELSLNWSAEDGLRRRTNTLEPAGRAALVATVNLADAALAFNPYGDGSNSSNRAIIEPLINRSKLPDNKSDNELWSVDLDLNGDVFDLGGGAAKLAVGSQFRRESLSTESYSSAGLQSVELSRTTDLSRDIVAVYAELFLPFVTRTNGKAGLQRLEVSLAARYEDYSDFGNSIDPKMGLLWSPLQSLILRGTIGTSYRAPSLTSLDDNTLSPVFYIPPAFFGDGILFAQGRNSDLREEEATTWTAGFQWSPKYLDGFSFDATYFNVEFTGRIETPSANPFAAIGDPRFASIVTRNPAPELIAALVNGPNFQPDRFAPSSADDLISGAVPVDLILDNRLTNLAESVVTGIEVQLSYATDTEIGAFAAGLNGNYLIDFKRKLLSADPLVDEVDTFGRPVDFRARGNVTWSRNDWSITGFVNYTDGYSDTFSSPAKEVNSWTTMDLTVAYDFDNDSSFLSGARLTLTTQNLFDEDPPFVDTPGGVGYDSINANPLGRFFAFHLTKTW
ncbi:MAG: TonB-dependent receptor [Pseudomonadota bacterium]